MSTDYNAHLEHELRLKERTIAQLNRENRMLKEEIRELKRSLAIAKRWQSK